MKKKTEIKVANDQIGSPTHAVDLAGGILIHHSAWTSGIDHYSNEGTTTWYCFAKEVSLNREIKHIPSREYKTPAKRPSYSLLDKGKIQHPNSALGNSLAQCITNLSAL